MEGLTEKQKRFCEEYMIDMNATQSAIRSGYSESTAGSIGSENLTKPYIQEYLSVLKKEVSERNKITVDECVSMLANMARFDVSDIYDDKGVLKPISEIPKESRMVIESIETDEMRVEGMVVSETKKLKLSSRRANIIELMKYLGGYEIDNKQKTQSNVTVYKLPDNGRS